MPIRFSNPYLTAILTLLLCTADGWSQSNKDERKTAVDALGNSLRTRYINEELGARAADFIGSESNLQKYEALDKESDFAQALKQDVQSIIADKHFDLWFSAEPLPQELKPSPEGMERQRQMLRRFNGFAKSVEILPGNLGLFRIDALFPLEHCQRPIESGLRFLHETEAFILDLRQNGGGEPETVAWFCGQFFADRKLVSKIRWRETDRIDEQWTQPPNGDCAYLDKPVYILVSKETASGAEGLAYFLQKSKRAVIVGETTWGGAHPGITVTLSKHFAAVIPNGETICPIDGSNWERTGVVPQIQCAAEDALRKAQAAALRALIDQADEEDRWFWEDALKKLEK